MKKLIISVLSIVMICSLSLGVAAEDSGTVLTAEEFEAQLQAMDAELSQQDVAEEGVSLSAGRSGMDTTLSKENVTVTYYKQIVDTFNGVPAYYEPVTSGSDFQCSEYITRYYKAVYGRYPNFVTTTSPQPGDYIHATASQRGKSYGHYAVVKSVGSAVVNGERVTTLTIIEQNWAWNSNGAVIAAKNRVIPYGGAYAGSYTVYRPQGNAIIKDDTIEVPNRFSDVESNRWSSGAINSLVQAGILTGYSDGTFRPAKSVTRAEFVTMLAKAWGGDYKQWTTPRFKGDVPASHWAFAAINWAQQKGIVKGVSANYFDPEANITRQEAAQMLYNYAKFKDISLSSTSSLSFYDAGSIEGWASEAIKAMVGSGVITGHDDGSFAPKAETSREQAATMLYKLTIKN